MKEETRRVITFDNLNDFMNYASKAEVKAYVIYLQGFIKGCSSRFFLKDGTEITIGTKIDTSW